MILIKTALLSFGMSGRVFHAPFLQAHPGFELVGVWERSQSLSIQYYPGIRIYRSLEELLNDVSIDLVIVNTPTHTHYEYTRKVLLAGKHAVVEKAFTTTAAEAVELTALAAQQQKQLSVFQNRRWDSDFTTVQQVIQEGWLGNIVEAEIHFDRYKEILSPKLHKEIPNPGAGLLKDLGPHLVDQALCLFGKPQAVFADIRITRPASQVDDYFDLLLYYDRLRVRLKSGYLVREPVPAYIIHGTKGSFLKSRADVQETLLQADVKPSAGDWALEPASAQGLLHTERDGTIILETIPTLPGNYYAYYDRVYEALTDHYPMPVTAEEGCMTMQILEAAWLSSEEKKQVLL